MILGPSWFTFGGSVALAFALGGAGGFYKGAVHGKAVVQAKWDVQKVKDREALDRANVNAEAAAELYEEAKAKQRIKVVTITKEVTNAIAAAPAWAAEPVPAGVRDAIAAASAALATAEPVGAVPVDAAASGNERGTGFSVRAGAAGVLRLLSPAPGAGEGR